MDEIISEAMHYSSSLDISLKLCPDMAASVRYHKSSSERGLGDYNCLLSFNVIYISFLDRDKLCPNEAWQCLHARNGTQRWGASALPQPQPQPFSASLQALSSLIIQTWSSFTQSVLISYDSGWHSNVQHNSDLTLGFHSKLLRV